MGLLHASGVQRKKLDILFQYSHRDIELNYISDIDKFGPKKSS